MDRNLLYSSVRPLFTGHENSRKWMESEGFFDTRHRHKVSHSR